MNEEIINNEVLNADNEKQQKIKNSLSNLANKKSKFLFVVPDIPNPNASIYEIYFHATTVKEMGFDVILLTEKGDYVKPNWIEEELTDHKHIALSSNKLNVGPEDFLIIPEVFSNVMEQTKSLPCVRIGLLQSVDFMMSALIPGTDWKSFGINNVITTSKSLKDFVKSYFGENKFNVKSYNPGIPDYFKKSDTPQKPIISIIGRNPNEISKVIKLFYARYPHYNWLTFDPMLTKSKPPEMMRRKDFADRLKNNFAAVWIDRIASWGTFPLECMKSGVLPICLKPDITPEYILNRDENDKVVGIKENAGLWTDNFYDIPVLIGDALVGFLDDNIGDNIYESMENIASQYSPENAKKELIEIYSEFINDRVKLFESALTENENKE